VPGGSWPRAPAGWGLKWCGWPQRRRETPRQRGAGVSLLGGARRDAGSVPTESSWAATADGRPLPSRPPVFRLVCLGPRRRRFPRSAAGALRADRAGARRGDGLRPPRSGPGWPPTGALSSRRPASWFTRILGPDSGRARPAGNRVLCPGCGPIPGRRHSLMLQAALSSRS